jgi:hypothetical protein
MRSTPNSTMSLRYRAQFELMLSKYLRSHAASVVRGIPFSVRIMVRTTRYLLSMKFSVDTPPLTLPAKVAGDSAGPSAARAASNVIPFLSTPDSSGGVGCWELHPESILHAATNEMLIPKTSRMASDL